MKSVDDFVTYIRNRLSEGELEVNTSDIYGEALALQSIVAAKEYEYKDTIRMLLSLVENGYDWNNYYQYDIVCAAKRLSKED